MPQALVAFLNKYLSVITDIIEAHGGFVDKYIGDAVVAVFGAPLPDRDHALHAVQAALACQTRLDAMRSAFGLPGDAAIATRIGINSGDMLVGNIGSVRRFNYTVMGDAVNLASRLEGANKAYGTRVLISGGTRALCTARIAFREIDTVRVVGRARPVTVYEPLGAAGAMADEQHERLAAFAHALADYRAARFESAEAGFAALADAGDGPAAAFADRIRRIRSAPPGAAWDGVTDLDSK